MFVMSNRSRSVAASVGPAAAQSPVKSHHNPTDRLEAVQDNNNSLPSPLSVESEGEVPPERSPHRRSGANRGGASDEGSPSARYW